MNYDNPDEYWRKRKDELFTNEEQEYCECDYIIRSGNIIEINEMSYNLSELTDND